MLRCSMGTIYAALIGLNGLLKEKERYNVGGAGLEELRRGANRIKTHFVNFLKN